MITFLLLLAVPVFLGVLIGLGIGLMLRFARFLFAPTAKTLVPNFAPIQTHMVETVARPAVQNTEHYRRLEFD